MASVRPGPHGRGRQGELLQPQPPSQPKRMGAYMETSTEEFPASLSRRARKEAENARAQTQGAQRTTGPSRIPQTSSSRKTSFTSSQGSRPPLTHQGRSWGSVGSSGSGKTSNVPVASFSSSSKSQDGLKQPRNVLRRKHSNVSQETASMRNDSGNDSYRSSSSSSAPRSQTSLDSTAPCQLDRALTESPTEIRIAQRVELPTTTAHTVRIYPELDRYRDIKPPSAFDSPGIEVPYRIATHDLPPPTPLFSGTSSQVSGFSGSPSTRFSESPGPGPYSRDTTPTSISSQSPGLVAPMRVPTSRARQGSPALTRPPVTRRRAGSVPNEAESIGADPQGLAAVRESLNSSSSNSTVRDVEKKEKKKTKRLSPLPPSPPPRKSSQKFKKSRDEQSSPSKSAKEPAHAVMTAVSPSKAISTKRTARPAAVATSPRATPPIRPSRDGTPDLQSQLGLPMPIIHSNLSSTSLPDRRQSISLVPSSLPRSTTPSSQPDRARPLSKLPVGREATPAPRPGTASDGPLTTAQQQPGRTTRTPSPSVSTFKTRFPLFGRRTKTAPEVQVAEKKDRAARKGPAAGTGHEGYGRLGAVRRRSGSASRGPVSSQESLSSGQSQDPFLAERMNPVIIAGGEIVENRNASSELSRTDSSQSFGYGQPASESQNSSQVSLSSQDARSTLWPSAFPRGSMQGPNLSHRRPSDSSDSEALAMKSTLAFRRSVQRFKSADQTPLRLPKPIVVRPGVGSPSINSLDTSVMSDDSMYDPRPESVRGRKQPTAPTPKKLTKRAKSPRKWNFFGRSQSQPATVPKQQVDTAKMVAATVKVVQQKPVAFYTMDFSEQEDADFPDVEEVLRDAHLLEAPLSPQIPVPRQRRPSNTRVGAQQDAPTSEIQTRSEMAQVSRRLPPVISSPERLAGLTQTSLGQQAPSPQPPTGRPSRLPQVGRIPKVVSARPEQTSPKSFSRPFNRISIQMPPARVEAVDLDSIAKGASPPKPSSPTPDLIQEGSTLTSGKSNSPTRFRQSREFSPDAERGHNEFLRFSPRYNSQCTSTTTTSSSSGVLTYADATAVVPDVNAPLVEDEIWDEYNDLLGEDNLKVPPSATSSQGKPFHLENWGRRLVKEENHQSLESPTITVHPKTNGQDTMETVSVPTSSVYSQDMTAKINEALEAAGAAPLTPFSVTEFVTGYGDRNNSLDMGQPQAQRGSTSTDGKRRKARISIASTCSQVSEDNSPLSQVNLRVGSMTVSKWLTFGHVLFSPARDDLVPVVGSLKRHSILVVDGLGNDDWSFYAAETYPAATFFNLSPRAPLPAEHQAAATFPLSPPNHHQIQYLSHCDKFPFGPQSFTSVVYRFPAAAPEAHYRNIITEARRVLKPGGYIELSILDVDLNNMGNRSRRAVRQLKERIHSTTPDTSLGSTADLILRLLGRKGFSEIKTCRVGVPVASAIPRSSGSEGDVPNIAGTGGVQTRLKDKSKKDDRSLAEMMSDESPVADENITKMVAKVGRWWYNRCYESAAAGAGSTNDSMWNNRALLAECEEWGTSLKLMVCHARVPDGRSRVASI